MVFHTLPMLSQKASGLQYISRRSALTGNLLLDHTGKRSKNYSHYFRSKFVAVIEAFQCTLDHIARSSERKLHCLDYVIYTGQVCTATLNQTTLNDVQIHSTTTSGLKLLQNGTRGYKKNSKSKHLSRNEFNPRYELYISDEGTTFPIPTMSNGFQYAELSLYLCNVD